MKIFIQTVGAAAAVVALAAGCTGGSTADEAGNFPAKGSTIEWIVPSAAGAGNDILARIMAPAMQESLGANVKVVNKEGGSQVIGLNYAANAKPDGHTLVYTNVPSILGRYLDPSKKAGFDRESFIPIGSFASNAIVIGVNKSSRFNSIGELFDAVKTNPGTVTVGTDSRGGDDHINLRILEDELGLKFNIVHYNSGAEKIAAVVAGETDFALGGISSFFGQYKSGELKLLTVIQDSPSDFIPEVPTLASQGYQVDAMSNNFAISVPKGTPAETVAVLENALKKAEEDPAVQAKLEASGTQPVWESGADVEKIWLDKETVIKPIIAELLQSNG
ncbi:tripartite tricarboxylate transporter substrate binding protein [Mycolicibacterium sp. P9-22]|uniref:tripartite tricarboxylate transporter substrate binding protein n=1 Tax=Mycolicibacterium sp. P9-22 TaxID=2024613 RepID=UPI0011EBE9AD|nr:tripartite tricarboxylate transporter substrate binding protein [Mycolicibacterium sp. P9-22]KAA0113565.1 tripartite tricarboxylate transporter substrate binding protein [Mycolicibacterium sp. P9-22]